IEFRHARRNAYVVLRFDLGVSDRLRFLQTKAVAGAAFLRGNNALFNQRIPLAAFGTLAQPLARLIAAALADEDGVGLFWQALLLAPTHFLRDPLCDLCISVVD